MNFNRLALVCCWVSVLGLAGCADLTSKPAAPPLSQSRQALYQLAAWKLEGRIAAKWANEGVNANLIWEHEGGQERLRVFGPFSQGMVSIVVQNDLVYINEGNGVVNTSRQAEELLKNRLGFSVPLPSLRYWVMGLPAPGIDYRAVLDASGGLKGFEQQGWVLDYASFDTVGGAVLPRKMSLRGKDVALKLIADEWVLKN